jgi:hypothetical protein
MSIKEEQQQYKLQKILDDQKKMAAPLLRKWLKKDFIKSELENINKLPEIKNE